MADKNNNEFKWNFNLDDADSDFTDIDFTNSEYEKSDKDIQPIIFVRDETAKKKAEEKKPAEEELPAASTAKKPAASSKKPAARKTAAKKKGSGGTALNWKLIAIIAAAVLLIALLVVLLGKCKKDEVKAWTKVESDDKVKTLMDNYFTAKKNGKADDMREVLVTDAIVNASVLAVESNIYSDYSDIQLQKYPGINKDESVVCAAYNTELTMLNGTPVPTIGWFYSLPDEAGNLRLMTTTELNKAENKSILEYVGAASALLSDTTVKDVQTRFNNAVNSNDILKQYLQNIKAGNYYDVPQASTEAPESTEPADTTEEQPTESQEEPTTAPGGTFVYVNATTLNVRDKASTDSNVIWKFSKGWCVTLLSEEGDWVKIRDDVSTNPANGSVQDCKNFEGYISKQYIVYDYSEIQW